MTTSKELNLARKSLVASLGENSKVYANNVWHRVELAPRLYLLNLQPFIDRYFDKMKLWFQMKTTKEEFDCEARNIMTEDQVRLHNEFLACLLNKVCDLATTAPIRKFDRDKSTKEKRLRLKRKYRTDKSNFEPADMYVEVLSQNSSPVGDEPIGANRSSAQELILPDRTFVLARLMLAAWENNMDGAEENTAHVVVTATQIFLKNILTAIVTRRKGFDVKKESFIYNIGEPVPSSWKRNSSYTTRLSRYSATEVVDPYGQVPAIRRTYEQAEQATAFAIACSTQTVSPTPKPVSTADLRHALKVYKNLISSHTIYATNMERLYTYETHPTWEEIEARRSLRRQYTS